MPPPPDWNPVQSPRICVLFLYTIPLYWYHLSDTKLEFKKKFPRRNIFTIFKGFLLFYCYFLVFVLFLQCFFFIFSFNLFLFREAWSGIVVFPRKVASLSPAFRLSPKGYFHVLPVLPPMYWFTDLDSDPRHFAVKIYLKYPVLANSMLGFYIDIRYPVCCIDGSSLRTSIILDSLPPPPLVLIWLMLPIWIWILPDPGTDPYQWNARLDPHFDLYC